MLSISKDTIEKIREASDIVHIIGNYVPLKKSGREFKALSPFNKEKTPSFYVDPSKGLFKCFSSGHGGDVFKFLMLYENLNFPEAVKRLADQAGIVISENPEARMEMSRRDVLYKVHVAVVDFWSKILHEEEEGELARAYLKQRCIPLSLAKEFRLGYAPSGWDRLINWGRNNGYSRKVLEESGLLSSNESGKYYDRFRDRLIFPISNDAGRIVAFSGRILDKENKGAKYVNSSDTLIFNKSRILYGMDKNKREILDQNMAILCEGQFDLIRCHAHGIKNVVAPQGTSFTEAHARLLKRFCNEVTVCFDSDRAGVSAASRSVDVLIEEDLEVYIAEMPMGEDPDSFLKKNGKEKMEEILREALSYPKYFLESYVRNEDISTSKGKANVSKKMAETVVKIPNRVRQEAISLEVATYLGISLESFQEEMRKVKKTERRGEAVKEEKVMKVPPLIEHLICLLLGEADLTALVHRTLEPRWIKGAEGSEIVFRLLKGHECDGWENAAQFISDAPTELERNYLAGILLKPHQLSEELTPDVYSLDLLHQLKVRWIKRSMTILEQEIKSPQLRTEDLEKKSKELVDLRKMLL